MGLKQREEGWNRVLQHDIIGERECVCDSFSPAKALSVGFSGSELVYLCRTSLAPEMLINRTTAALFSQSLQSYTRAGGGRWWRTER